MQLLTCPWGKCKYFSSSHTTQKMPSTWEGCTKCNKMDYFREMCRSVRGSTVHNIEQEDAQEQENHIEAVTINSINPNAKHLVLKANLKHHET